MFNKYWAEEYEIRDNLWQMKFGIKRVKRLATHDRIIRVKTSGVEFHRCELSVNGGEVLMAYGHGFIDVIFLSGSIQRSWFIIHIEISLIKGYFGVDFIGMWIFSFSQIQK